MSTPRLVAAGGQARCNLARELGNGHELMAAILTVQTVIAIVTVPVLTTLIG